MINNDVSVKQFQSLLGDCINPENTYLPKMDPLKDGRFGKGC